MWVSKKSPFQNGNFYISTDTTSSGNLPSPNASSSKGKQRKAQLNQVAFKIRSRIRSYWHHYYVWWVLRRYGGKFKPTSSPSSLHSFAPSFGELWARSGEVERASCLSASPAGYIMARSEQLYSIDVRIKVPKSGYTDDEPGAPRRRTQ